MPPTKFLSRTWETGDQLALTAIAAHPTLAQAVEYLKDAENIVTTEKALSSKAHYYKAELEEIREQLAPRVEAIRANDMLDNAGLATELERMCMERLQTQLEQGRVKDPARVARDLADLKAKNVDKRLAVQGRPTQITETRNLAEIVKALQGLGVAEVIDPATGESEIPELSSDGDATMD